MAARHNGSVSHAAARWYFAPLPDGRSVVGAVDLDAAERRMRVQSEVILCAIPVLAVVRVSTLLQTLLVERGEEFLDLDAYANVARHMERELTEREIDVHTGI